MSQTTLCSAAKVTQRGRVTCAYHASIFSMEAVMFCCNCAFREGSFCPRAVDFIQPDEVRPLSKVSISWCCYGYPTAQLFANNLSIFYIPAIIAHTSLPIIINHLNSPNEASWAICQSECASLCHDVPAGIPEKKHYGE